MTPKQAILQECKYCFNGEKAAYEKCKSKECMLNNLEIKSWTRRIKAHCIQCVPEQSIYGVQACKGKVITPEPRICPLHQYRLGKNPKRQAVSKARSITKDALEARLSKNKAKIETPPYPGKG